VAANKYGSLSAIEAMKDKRADRKFTAQAEQRKRGAEWDAKAEREEAQVQGWARLSVGWRGVVFRVVDLREGAVLSEQILHRAAALPFLLPNAPQCVTPTAV